MQLSSSHFLSRLGSLSFDEVLTRGRQEFSKRVGLLRFELTGPYAFEGDSASTSSFFFQPEELSSLVELNGTLFPAQTKALVERADRICRHKFDLLGYRGLDYGRNIDWHHDAVNKKRAPLRPWFKIHYLDFQEVGDAKVTWELNRLQHLVCLAKAHLVTKDFRYIDELKAQFASWMHQNPYPYGINWASSLEVAFRVLSLLWIERLLTGCDSLDSRFWSNLIRILALSGRHISRYLSTYFSPNTHLLGEAVSLFFLGVLHPELEGSNRWKEKGWDVILQQSVCQVQPDGMYFEQSIYYHVYALDFFLHSRILAERNGLAVPPALDIVLQRMLNVLAILAKRGNAIPGLGDDDGGRLFDPSRNLREHMADPLSTGAILFGRGDLKTAAGCLCEETLWLFGPAAAKRFSEVSSAETEGRSVAFEASGIYVMECRGQQVVIDAGPQGAGRAGHGHADALSLCLSLNGEPWLVDPGTFAYAGSGNERLEFRGTQAHNTLQVDGLSQAKAAGPFAWNRLPHTRVDCWHSSGSSDLLVAAHNGYGRLSEPVVHRRWVFYRKPWFCLVRDVAHGVGRHQLDLRWHLAPELSATVFDSCVTVYGAGKQCLKMVSATPSSWSCNIDQGWVSPAYGAKQGAPVVHFATQASLPAGLATLLLFDTREESVGSFSALGDWADSAVQGYLYDSADAQCYFFFSERRHRWQLGPWVSDARFLYCEVRAQEVADLVLCDGTGLSFNGDTILALSEPVAWHESGRDARASWKRVLLEQKA
jgi:hypothetical protein